jgi:uncharacterized cupredoxin-like copper-binding protein
MSRYLLALLVAVALAAAACSGGASPEPETSEAPSDGAAATTIDVQLTDALKIEPEVIDVPAGASVTFVVSNTGTTEHEFVVGDEEVQQEHEDEMAEGMEGEMMEDMANAVHLEPGETKELTMTFSDAGSTLAGCHVVGHYAAGMKATINVGS